MRSYLKTLNLKFSCVFLITYFALAFGCGTPAVSPSFGARVINGEEAKPNSWPWMVYLKATASDGTFMCGGSIIDKETILTAAHCVDMISDLSQLFVIVGLHDLSLASEKDVYSVSNIHIHFQYNSVTFRNDVAIIKLKNSLTFSNKVSPVCLPSARSHSFAFGKNVVATGWGKTQNGDTTNLLQQAKLKVVNETFFNLIKSAISEFEPTEQYAVIEDLPENNPDTNICSGDSGGPLVFLDGNRWTIYGVTSYVQVDSSGKCIASLPSFFQSVPFYSNFINNFLNSSTASSFKLKPRAFFLTFIFLLTFIV